MNSEDPSPDTGTCDSCGRTDEVVAAVRRVYLDLTANNEPANDDPAAVVEASEVLDEVERWCPTCRDQYPHIDV